MLDDAIKNQLRGYFERIVASDPAGRLPRRQRKVPGNAGAARRRRGAVAQDFAGPRRNRRAQAILRSSGARARMPRVDFAGLPMGHEFNSLILALLHVGGYAPKESPETIKQVEAIEGEYHFETFFSLSCQNCPDVVQALNLLCAINPGINHIAIDGALFPDEVEARKIMAVPADLPERRIVRPGPLGLEQLLAKIDTGASVKRRRKAEGQAALRRAGRRRRPGRRGRRDLCGAQGHRHRRRRRTLRRPGAGHDGRSRISSPSRTPRAPNSPPRWSSTSRNMTSTS